MTPIQKKKTVMRKRNMLDLLLSFSLDAKKLNDGGQVGHTYIDQAQDGRWYGDEEA